MQLECEQFQKTTMFGLRKNVFKFSDKYNPIVPASPGGPRLHNVFMVSSDCSYASFINTNHPSFCNVVLKELAPAPSQSNKHWEGAEFQSADQWRSVMRQPILCIKLQRSIEAGEELFMQYELPPGTDMIQDIETVRQDTTIQEQQPAKQGTDDMDLSFVNLSER